MDDVMDWLKIAKSNLAIGKSYHKFCDEDIRFEELCFELQQCVEKSFKAILVYKNIKFPKTHSIEKLIDLLNNNNFNVPGELLESVKLTSYATETRYPDDYSRITEDEYNEAIGLAEKVYNWALSQVD